jgi:inactivated superfamily I helicase
MGDAQKEWVRLPMLEQRVQGVVQQHHRHLDGLTIAVIGRPKAGKAKGKVVYAKATVPSAATLALIRDDLGPIHYVIEIGLDAWETLSEPQRTALLDHELCHCAGVDEETGHPTLVGHDVEEFGQIIRRHGLWRPDLELFASEVEKALEAQLAAMGAPR